MLRGAHEGTCRCVGALGRTVLHVPAKSTAIKGFPILRPKRLFASSAPRQDLLPFLQPVHTTLIDLQEATGLSWPVIIPLATVVLRASLTLPMSIYSRVLLRRQTALAPLVSAMSPIFKAQLARSTAVGKSSLTAEQIKILAAKERRKQRIALFKEHHCQNWKMLLLPTIQIPLFIAMSLTIRAMCGWAVVPGITIEEAFVTEGFLWCTDLVRPDPTGALPLLFGAAALANVEVSASQAPAKPGPSIAATLVNMSRFGTICFMAMAFQAPAAIGLYWLSSNTFSLIQNVLLNKLLPISPPLEYPEAARRLLAPSSAPGQLGRGTSK